MNKNIELLETNEVKQAFAELMAGSQPEIYLEGLNQIAWLLTTDTHLPTYCCNALFPIISFFLALSKAEKKNLEYEVKDLNRDIENCKSEVRNLVGQAMGNNAPPLANQEM